MMPSASLYFICLCE